MEEPTKNEYRRLGDRIRNSPENVTMNDLEMLQAFRMTYKDALSTVFKILEKMAVKCDDNCVCTYRVKRIESIVSKLQRLPKMQLQRAEDIAGCRCILSKEEQVYELLDRLEKGQSVHNYKIHYPIHDYIKTPKSTGYRSIHVNVQLKDDWHWIEIQLRSLPLHNWATMVETTDVLYQTRLKEIGEESDKDLFEFHKLLSYKTSELSIAQKIQLISISKDKQYLEKISGVYGQNYVLVRSKWHDLRKANKPFILISIGISGNPSFELFQTFEEAETAYFDKFQNNTESLNIVLTHIRNLDYEKVSVAYSNYFMTYNAILVKIHRIFSQVLMYFYNYSFKDFKEYYPYYLHLVYDWCKNAKEELGFIKKALVKKTKRPNMAGAGWVRTYKKGLIEILQIFYSTDVQLKFSLLHPSRYHYKKQHYNMLEKKINELNMSLK